METTTQQDQQMTTVKHTPMTTEQIAQHLDDGNPMTDSLSQIAALAEESQDPYQKGWLTGIFQFRQQLSILTGRS